MLGPYTREKIENWVGEFCGSDAIRAFDAGVREFAPQVLATLLSAACEVRDIEPEDVEEADLKGALLGPIARLALPASSRPHTPELCAVFLTQLEAEGRLGDGRMLGAFVRALKPSFEQQSSGKGETYTRPGSKLGRNDPCPCGSGKKYKKCCMGE